MAPYDPAPALRTKKVIRSEDQVSVAKSGLDCHRYQVNLFSVCYGASQSAKLNVTIV